MNQKRNFILPPQFSSVFQNGARMIENGLGFFLIVCFLLNAFYLLLYVSYVYDFAIKVYLFWQRS